MSTTEKHEFQAEIQQLLDIVVHSLYTDREIFLRELISNAADACEKARFLQSAGENILQPDLPFKIEITTDESAHTVTISDTGVGMTEAELVENLGTIAHSGSKAFLKQLAEKQQEAASLIGQFGVGFYSAFMAAKSVTVTTKSCRPDHPAWRWHSDGSGTYEIEPAPDQARGTKVVVALKEDAQDFAKPGRVEALVKRYSNFVSFPIELNGNRINTVAAIWARNKSEIKEEEYKEFYHYIGHDHQDPMYRLHFNADAPLAIQSVLFVPSKNWENIGMSRVESEVHLYCRRILIQSRAKDLFPDWLRFLKGVVDSEDLPLNIARENMQDSALLQKLNRVLTGRFIKFLEEQSTNDPEKYNGFFQEFGRFIKEGVVTDFGHREALGKLLRFESSALDHGQLTSLSEYITRMPEEQKEIYYLLAANRQAAESSPYYEAFRVKKWEVLFMKDPWDEFVMDHLNEFGGKPLRSAEKAEIKLDPESPDSKPLGEEQAAHLSKWLKETLGDQINQVQVSQRLVESPAVVVDSDKTMTAGMRRLLKSMQPDQMKTSFDLEINPRHPLMLHLDQIRENHGELAKKTAEQILDNAKIAAGALDDPRRMVQRLNELMQEMLAGRK